MWVNLFRVASLTSIHGLTATLELSPATQETKGPDAAKCRHPHSREATQLRDQLNGWSQVAKIQAHLFVFRLCIEPLLWFFSTKIRDASINYVETEVPRELHTLVVADRVSRRIRCTWSVRDKF